MRGRSEAGPRNVRRGQLNRFRPISDAVNSNQRSFPFGLWQTIGLITDRDKARAMAICARISDVPKPLLPPPPSLRFHPLRDLLSPTNSCCFFEFVFFLPILFPSSDSCSFFRFFLLLQSPFFFPAPCSLFDPRRSSNSFTSPQVEFRVAEIAFDARVR